MIEENDEKECCEKKDPNCECDGCYSWFHCECGQFLEDYYGQPGDGFCIKCR